MLDDDTYLSADNSYNLSTLRKNGDAATDEDRNRLEVRLNGCLASVFVSAFCVWLYG